MLKDALITVDSSDFRDEQPLPPFVRLESSRIQSLGNFGLFAEFPVIMVESIPTLRWSPLSETRKV